MIDSLLQALITIFLQILNGFSSIIITPIFNLLHSFLNLNFYPFIPMFSLFLDNYILPGVRFSRQLFINITGYPQQLLTLLVTIYLFKFFLYFALRIIMFVYNMWRLWRGGSTNS